ncbi:MAG TPA: heme A synthase [Candidatus Dadabacteria bacterium]|nr:heme A synthase [Candidatus Dadabacteria bacterium]
MNTTERLTLFFLVLLLIWGNMVSGLGAGLACPDWPLCFGEFFPQLNFAIFMEHTHRILGLLVTIFFIFLAKNRLKTYVGKQKLIPILCSIFLATQIILGGLVVIFQLETNITTFHFANAIIIFILVYTMCIYSDSAKLKQVEIFNKSNLIYICLFIIIYFQLVLGSYVRHADAGLACPDFPKCLGYWMPPYLSKTVFIHLLHRFTGFLILIISLILFLVAYYKETSKSILQNARRLLFLVGLQVILGIFVVVSKLSFSITAIHLLIALLIVILVLNIIFEEKAQ